MEVIQPNLRKAVKVIKSGKILICPTDTVYGLICRAGDKKAIEKIYKIKKRPKNKPLPVFVNTIVMAKAMAMIDKNQEKFLKKIWPGKTTVIFNSRKSGTIGIRIPDHKFVLNLVKHTGPLMETSANISGMPPTTKIEEVLKYFKGRKYQPDLVLDAGDLKPAKPSQVVDLTGLKPKVLRK